MISEKLLVRISASAIFLLFYNVLVCRRTSAVVVKNSRKFAKMAAEEAMTKPDVGNTKEINEDEENLYRPLKNTSQVQNVRQVFSKGSFYCSGKTISSYFTKQIQIILFFFSNYSRCINSKVTRHQRIQNIVIKF